MKLRSSIFWTLVIVFALFIAYMPVFGIVDDHILTTTQLVGKNIPLFIFKDIGRFFPLCGQDLNILSYFFTPTAEVFYFFNAICLILVCFLLSAGFELVFKTYFLNARSFAYFATLLIVFSPAFVTSWLRLFVPERMEFVFLSLFFYSYMVLYTHSSKKTLFYSCVCVFSSLIIMFYKETAFILLGSYAFFNLVFCRISKKKIFKIDFFILLNCLIWIVCYVFFVVLQKNGGGMYSDTPYNRFFIFLKDLVNYCLNDPIVVFGTVVFVFIRFYSVVFRQSKILPLYDAMMYSSMLFVLTYAYLGLSNLHYLLPSYIFAIVSIFVFFRLYWSKLCKVFILFLSSIYICSCLPLSFYSYMLYRCSSQNFQDTLFFLKNLGDSQKNIYLEGVNRASGVEIYTSFGEWMKFYGIKNFDFFSDLPIDHVTLGQVDANSPYTIFKTNAITAKKKGDLIILLAYSGSFVTYQLIEELKKKNRLIFTANHGWNIPSVGLKSLAKLVGIFLTKDRNDFSFSHNIFGLPIFIYVFQVE